MKGGTGAGVHELSVGRRLRFSLGRYATVFHAEVYAILACVYEIQSQNRPEKYASICSDSLAALKALRAVRTRSRLVHQCQRALNHISVRHAVGPFFGSPDMLEYGAMQPLMGSQGAALLWDSSDPSWPWGSLGETYKRGLVAG
jgi:hypothetical protein